MSEPNPATRIREIAENIRGLPEALRGIPYFKHTVATRAAQLLLEAIERGAFGALEFIRLRELIQREKNSDWDDWLFGAWLEAIYCLVPELPNGGSAVRFVVPACEPIAELLQIEAQKVGDAPPPDSPWVPAINLWLFRFKSRKGRASLNHFREQHPEMFRNPSRYKLEIHAPLWTTHWAEKDAAAFDSLDGDPESIADDPDNQAEFLQGAADVVGKLRAEKKAGKQ